MHGCCSHHRLAGIRITITLLNDPEFFMTAQTNLPPFHLAFPVRDLAEARAFYGEKLGCPEGRSSNEWIDFNFYGHQIVAHLAPSECGHNATSAVDSHNVPVRHFGAVLSMEQWEAMSKRLIDAGTEFVIEPYIRFKGEVGEQATMFFLDPSGNALEFKAFKNMDSLFAK
jgi:extradiol dioxygenase family protein